MKKKILLGLALIFTMLSLSSCSALVNFLNTTDRTLQDFDRLLQNGEGCYRKLQRTFGCEQTNQDTTAVEKADYYYYTARP